MRLLAVASHRSPRSQRAAGATTPSRSSPRARRPSCAARSFPSVHLFGEPVVAQVDVILDRTKVDPADVRLKTDFEPYEPVGETREERKDIGDYTVIRYTTTLDCLSEFCIPRTAEGETTVSQLPGLPPFLPGQQRDEKLKFEFPPALLVQDGGAEGQDARSSRLGATSFALAHQLVRLERRRPGLPVRRDRGAAARSRSTGSRRRCSGSRCSRSRWLCSPCPCGSSGAEGAGTPRRQRTQAPLLSPLERALQPGGVGESPAVRRRAPRGARGTRLRARPRAGRRLGRARATGRAGRHLRPSRTA